MGHFLSVHSAAGWLQTWDAWGNHIAHLVGWFHDNYDILHHKVMIWLDISFQFIQQQGDFKPEDIHHMDIGQKDMKKGIRAVLHEIFQLPRSNKRKLNRTDTVAKSGSSQRFYYMLHVVSSNSEFDKMTQGNNANHNIFLFSLVFKHHHSRFL